MADLALAAAGIVLSPFLQVFFERMASRDFDDFFRRRKLSDSLLRKLKMALLSVNAVLEDAEDKQFRETSVKKWLDEVKDTVYDAEDILDVIATKDLQRKLDSEFGTIASKSGKGKKEKNGARLLTSPTNIFISTHGLNELKSPAKVSTFFYNINFYGHLE